MNITGGYINLHTHRVETGEHLHIYNHIVKTANENIPAGFFSAGIHPWYIGELEVQENQLQKMVLQHNCLAIGETGLDKDCNTPAHQQQRAFRFQCQLGVSTHKPLILHAVKSHFDMIQVLKDTGVKKAVFHGYNNRYTILEKILENGFFVSMGAALLQERSQALALVAQVPATQLFLETDDSDIAIEKIYAAAAEQRQVTLAELQAQLVFNFNQLFTT
jgi:TatD DNase family protein